ncbi:iron chelate uptake ABC transporter family permease subunit, partial [Streptococcus anginosus]|nr:iron chelate uptake ABC transporter family permease subunit [Streptococcus anginosus]
AFTALYFVWNIPVAVGSEGFWIITRMRAEAVFSILLVAFCQSLATLAFQTVTTNRILTPSIMGFESLYSVIHTSTIFFFGVAGFVAFTGVRAFLIQVAIM